MGPFSFRRRHRHPARPRPGTAGTVDSCASTWSADAERVTQVAGPTPDSGGVDARMDESDGSKVVGSDDGDGWMHDSGASAFESGSGPGSMDEDSG